jgi:hypothetical protein
LFSKTVLCWRSATQVLCNLTAYENSCWSFDPFIILLCTYCAIYSHSYQLPKTAFRLCVLNRVCCILPPTSRLLIPPRSLLNYSVWSMRLSLYLGISV